MASQHLILAFLALICGAYSYLPCQFAINNYDYNFTDFGSLRNWFVAPSVNNEQEWFVPTCDDAFNDMTDIPCDTNSACYLDKQTGKIVNVGPASMFFQVVPNGLSVEAVFTQETCTTAAINVRYHCGPTQDDYVNPVVVTGQGCKSILDIKTRLACGVYNPYSNNGNGGGAADGDNGNTNDNSTWVDPIDVVSDDTEVIFEDISAFEIVMISLMAFSICCAMISCCICIKRKLRMRRAQKVLDRQLAHHKQQQVQHLQQNRYANVEFQPLPTFSSNDQMFQFVQAPAYLNNQQSQFMYYFPTEQQQQQQAQPNVVVDDQLTEDEKFARQLQSMYDRE